MENYTLLENYNTIDEAYIVRGMLASNGIPAVVIDRTNLYVPVFGGIDLMVPQAMLERARGLIGHNRGEI